MNLELEKEAVEAGAQTAGTHCVHILPASINNDVSGSNEGDAEVRLMYPLPSWLSLILRVLGTSLLRPYGLF